MTEPGWSPLGTSAESFLIAATDASLKTKRAVISSMVTMGLMSSVSQAVRSGNGKQTGSAIASTVRNAKVIIAQFTGLKRPARNKQKIEQVKPD